MEMRNFALALGHTEGWRAADALIQFITERAPSIRYSKPFRDAQALVLASWVESLPSEAANACSLLQRFAGEDLTHPAWAVIPPELELRKLQRHSARGVSTSRSPSTNP